MERALCGSLAIGVCFTFTQFPRDALRDQLTSSCCFDCSDIINDGLALEKFCEKVRAVLVDTLAAMLIIEGKLRRLRITSTIAYCSFACYYGLADAASELRILPPDSPLHPQ